MSNDWDLSAIVRSCSPSDAAAHKGIARNTLGESFFFPHDEFSFRLPQFHSHSHFPVLIHQRNAMDDPFDELSLVYKPFYPRVQQHLLTAAAAADSLIGGSEKKRRRRKEVQQRTNAAAPIADVPAFPINAAEKQKSEVGSQTQALRGRRRKEPRLVMKKNKESLSEDEWNWRKYGQKPIFGSMNPRSYYRCTSFKGCAARKQVDQCEDEPGMFIVTYIGDHTHRDGGGGGSDAGTTRNASSSPTSDDAPKLSDENGKLEDDNDIVMAMHALRSIGLEFTGGQLSLHRYPSAPPEDPLRYTSNVRESH